MISIKEIIRIIKEKQSISYKKDIIQQSNSSLCIDDFNNKVYISFNRIPIIPIDNSWTAKEILNKLEETRKLYVDFKIKQTH